MQYIDSFKSLSQQLDAEFQKSKLITHNASKGAVREKIITNMIRPFLPNCYGLSGGEAFDANGVISNQLDLVIYDSIYSYLIPCEENFIEFPIESVYGNIEVKSNLNKTEFTKAIHNIASLKKLHREPSRLNQVTPQTSVKVYATTEEINRVCNPLLGYIFAYDSPSINKIFEYFTNDIVTDNLSFLPEMIVLYKKKTILIHTFYSAKDSKEISRKDIIKNSYYALHTGDDTLGYFISHLLKDVENVLLKKMDLNNVCSSYDNYYNNQNEGIVFQENQIKKVSHSKLNKLIINE